MKSKNMKTSKILNAVDRIACIIAYPIAVGCILRAAYLLFGPYSYVSIEISTALGALSFVVSMLSSVGLAVMYCYNAHKSSWKLSKTLIAMSYNVLTFVRNTFTNFWKWLSED